MYIFLFHFQQTERKLMKNIINSDRTFNGQAEQKLYNYTPRERSTGGYIEITLSVRLSEQIRVRPITFLWFDIG